MLIHCKHPILATLLVLVMLIVNPAQAEEHHGEDDHHGEEHHDEKHQDETHNANSEAHIHGAAELFIVLDDKELQIELHSPAMNLVGFEHQAKTDEQIASIESARLSLENADDLFQISSAGCELKELKVDLGELAAENTDHHDEHSDEEAHDADDHDEDETHSDIEAQYRYTCEKPSSISAITTAITDQFPNVESLEVQWIINGRQGAVTLDENQREVVFK